MSDFILPRVYENEGGKYPQHKGKPKVSYSQLTSFNGEDPFLLQYIQQYFYEIDIPQGIFAEFGEACGTYFEKLEESELLSEKDLIILNRLERPEDAVYENEIVIDRGSYVIQGFSDQEYRLKNKLYVKDLKTGSGKKADHYADKKKYFQTRLYAYSRELEGEKIGGCGVILLHRKGNARAGTESKPHLRLHLEGTIQEIPTPYTKKAVESYLKTVDVIVERLSDLYKYYLKG